MVDEAERSLHDALCVVRDAIEDGKIVAGGGAPEAETAKQLSDYAVKVGGREQLAIEAFAEAWRAFHSLSRKMQVWTQSTSWSSYGPSMKTQQTGGSE